MITDSLDRGAYERHACDDSAHACAGATASDLAAPSRPPQAPATRPPDCGRCGIRSQSLFARLDAAALASVHDAIGDRRLAPGTRLFDEGERGSSVFTLRSGMVKLVRTMPDGTQRIVRLLGAGDAIGLEASEGARYESAAVALTDVAVCRIPVTALDTLNRSTPALHMQLIRKWHDALRTAERFIAEFNSGSARQRLARLLLMLAADRHNRAALLPGREDIGAILGLTTETASRTVAAFRREGLIDALDRVGRLFRIDRDALQAVADRLE